jgi:hypothetical protein
MRAPGPVAQRIERRTSNPRAEVRFLSGQLPKSLETRVSRDPHFAALACACLRGRRAGARGCARPIPPVVEPERDPTFGLFCLPGRCAAPVDRGSREPTPPHRAGPHGLRRAAPVSLARRPGDPGCRPGRISMRPNKRRVRGGSLTRERWRVLRSTLRLPVPMLARFSGAASTRRGRCSTKVKVSSKPFVPAAIGDVCGVPRDFEGGQSDTTFNAVESWCRCILSSSRLARVARHGWRCTERAYRGGSVRRQEGDDLSPCARQERHEARHNSHQPERASCPPETRRHGRRLQHQGEPRQAHDQGPREEVPQESEEGQKQKGLGRLQQSSSRQAGLFR